MDGYKPVTGTIGEAGLPTGIGQTATGGWQDTTGYQGGQQPQHVCPACGYCPCCGRGGTPVPYYPSPYVPPYQPTYPWYSPYTITCSVPPGLSG